MNKWALLLSAVALTYVVGFAPGAAAMEPGTLTAATAEETQTCPECGAKNATGAAYCSSCGEQLPKEAAPNYCPGCGGELEPGAAYCASCGTALTRRARGEWERNIVALSFNAGGIFVDGNRAYVGMDFAFQVADNFAFGPEFSYFFGGDSSGLFVGFECRPYAVPYSLPAPIKPHVVFAGGYVSETAEVWIFEVTGDGAYARVGGGIDFRIPHSMVVPYFDASVLFTFSGEEAKTKAQFEGGVRFAI
ncbi:MAG: zinc ribbon domain-containing protein [bacterium]